GDVGERGDGVGGAAPAVFVADEGDVGVVVVAVVDVAGDVVGVAHVVPAEEERGGALVADGPAAGPLDGDAERREVDGEAGDDAVDDLVAVAAGGQERGYAEAVTLGVEVAVDGALPVVARPVAQVLVG